MGEPTDRVSDKSPIHGYVRPVTKSKFEAYRRGIGLSSASELLTLLILREIEIKRLAATSMVVVGHERRDSKVSAYVDPARAAEFKCHVEGLGRSSSECAAALIERELEERWLLAALRMGGGST